MDSVRRAVRSEDGAIPVSVLLVIAAVAAAIYALFGAAEGDPDRYGRVPIPSTSAVSLPDEEVGVFYAQPASAVGRKTPPDDLRVRIVDQAGVSVETASRGGGRSNDEGWEYVPILAVSAPAAGTYRVEASSDELAATGGGFLAFGESAVGAVGDRLGNVGELVTSQWGVVAGVLLLLALVYPRFRRAWQRSRS